jgi:hypothetical protein
MDDGPGQGYLDWHCLAVVMKSFSKTQGKQREYVRKAGDGKSAGRLLPHSMALRCTSCLPAFIIDTGQSVASMAPY